ncbi:MAG: hypothetical protein ACTSYA_13520 [Candidatus Kariarchaeaceae archaeon]
MDVNEALPERAEKLTDPKIDYVVSCWPDALNSLDIFLEGYQNEPWIICTSSLQILKLLEQRIGRKYSYKRIYDKLTLKKGKEIAMNTFHLEKTLERKDCIICTPSELSRSIQFWRPERAVICFLGFSNPFNLQKLSLLSWQKKNDLSLFLHLLPWTNTLFFDKWFEAIPHSIADPLIINFLNLKQLIDQIKSLKQKSLLICDSVQLAYQIYLLSEEWHSTLLLPISPPQKYHLPEILWSASVMVNVEPKIGDEKPLTYLITSSPNIFQSEIIKTILSFQRPKIWALPSSWSSWKKSLNPAHVKMYEFTSSFEGEAISEEIIGIPTKNAFYWPTKKDWKKFILSAIRITPADDSWRLLKPVFSQLVRYYFPLYSSKRVDDLANELLPVIYEGKTVFTHEEISQTWDKMNDLLVGKGISWTPNKENFEVGIIRELEQEKYLKRTIDDKLLIQPKGLFVNSFPYSFKVFNSYWERIIKESHQISHEKVKEWVLALFNYYEERINNKAPFLGKMPGSVNELFSTKHFSNVDFSQISNGVSRFIYFERLTIAIIKFFTKKDR